MFQDLTPTHRRPPLKRKPAKASRKATTEHDRRIGELLKARRRKMKMSQEQLGQLAGGVSFQQVQKYENGTNRVGAARLAQMAAALDVPVTYFFADSGDDLPSINRKGLANAIAKMRENLDNIEKGLHL